MDDEIPKIIFFIALLGFLLLINFAMNRPNYNQICEYQYGEDYEYFCDERFDICFCGVDLGNNTIVGEKKIMESDEIKELTKECEIKYFKIKNNFDDCLEKFALSTKSEVKE